MFTAGRRAHNVPARDGRVAGFLYFGDMVNPAIVCDPALAYAMLDQPDPIDSTDSKRPAVELLSDGGPPGLQEIPRTSFARPSASIDLGWSPAL